MKDDDEKEKKPSEFDHLWQSIESIFNIPQSPPFLRRSNGSPLVPWELEHRRVFGDQCMARAKNYLDQKSLSPVDYNDMIANVMAASAYGVSGSRLILDAELTRLRQEGTRPIPDTPKAQLFLAHCYLTGIGRSQNPRTATMRYRKLAKEHNMPEAKFALGMCHYDGVGTKQDRSLALSLVKEAAAQGNVLAIRQEALWELMGLYPNRDLNRCFNLFKGMADGMCDPFSATLVGLYYQYGFGGLKKDTRTAEVYLNFGLHHKFSINDLGEPLITVLEDLICTYYE